MKMQCKPIWRQLLFFLAVSWGVGGLAALLTRGNTDVYETLRLPSFAPPGWLFPVMWSILYTLMGISAYLVFRAPASENRSGALTVFGVSLFVNFIWPLLFFNARAWWLSFWWILLLLALIVTTLVLYRRVRPVAALLQVPYLLWVTFASVLNLLIARFN